MHEVLLVQQSHWHSQETSIDMSIMAMQQCHGDRIPWQFMAIVLGNYHLSFLYEPLAVVAIWQICSEAILN